MFVSLESPSALGLCANEISVRHTLRVLQEMLCQYWDFGEGFGATSNTLTYQWRGAAEVGTNTQHTSCSAGMVCVPAPVPGRTQGNLPLLWQKITLCTGCKGKMSVHTSSSSKAVNHCQFTPWLWTFIPYITQSWCTAVQAAQAQHRWLLPELQLQKLSERECKLWRVLLILDKPKQLMDTVCILIHLRLGLLLAYFAFWFFLCSSKVILHQGFKCCRGIHKCLGNKKLNTLFIKSKAVKNAMKAFCPFHALQKHLKSICQADHSSDLYEKSLTRRSWQPIIKD